MRRRGNCGFAPPGADEAKTQFPQPRRFAGRGFTPRPANGKCGKADQIPPSAEPRPGPRRQRKLFCLSQAKSFLAVFDAICYIQHDRS